MSVHFDARRWWQRPGRSTAVVALPLAALAAAVWWAATTTVAPAPALHRAPVRSAPAPAPVTAAVPLHVPIAAQPSEVANTPMAQAAPPSIMVAPGVHITPLSVPAGTEPMPAGPREHDSEPEN